MDVVLYMRYSSSAQTEQSIEGQDRVCTAFCERKGYNIIGRYIDRATSAAHNIEKRVEFLRMVQESAKRHFQAVVVYKLDRFARNRYDASQYKFKLKQNGVKVISATEEIPDTPESVIMESVLEGFAEYYSRELSQKVSRGRTESAHKGRFLGGRVPYGYLTNEDHILRPDPDTAWIVKDVFERVGQGEKFSAIANDYNSKGILYRGRPWDRTAFTWLSNRVYLGEYRYMDKVVIPDAFPALIDEHTFDLVQGKMATRQHNKWHPTKVTYLLTGKVYCGHCGSLCIGESGTSCTGETYYYYACSEQKNIKKRNCSKRRVPKDWLEDTVFDMVKDSLTDETIDTLAEMAYQACLDELNSSKVGYYEEQVKDREKRISNLMASVELGINIADIVERVKILKAEKAELEDQLSYERSKTFVITKEQVSWFLHQFFTGQVPNHTIKDAVLTTLVHRVYIWDSPDGTKGTRIQVHLTIGDSSQKCIYGSPNAQSTNSPSWLDLTIPVFADWAILIEKEYH